MVLLISNIYCMYQYINFITNYNVGTLILIDYHIELFTQFLNVFYIYSEFKYHNIIYFTNLKSKQPILGNIVPVYYNNYVI